MDTASRNQMRQWWGYTTVEGKRCLDSIYYNRQTKSAKRKGKRKQAGLRSKRASKEASVYEKQ